MPGTFRGQAVIALLGSTVASQTVPSMKMSSVVAAAAVAAVLASTVIRAEAAGVRRIWRGYTPIGSISRNVITPYYVGYYGSHYSYYRPDPIYFPPRPFEACWLVGAFGEAIYVC
jgi:hypothetical protein